MTAWPLRPQPAPQMAIRMNTATLVATDEAVADLNQRTEQIVARVLAAQGLKALTNTRRAAAHHEAGHAVIDALDGIETKYCKVKRRYDLAGTEHWLGFTEADSPWSVTPDTSPEEDIRNMRRIVAGWASEILFEGDDLALGSSLDETLIAGNLAAWIAEKLRKDPEAVFRAVMLRVLAGLTIRERHVRAIAAALLRERVLRGPKLQRLLPPALDVPPEQRGYPAPMIAQLDDTMATLCQRINGAGT